MDKRCYISDLTGGRAIGGHFELEREERLVHAGRPLVYLVGMGIVDRSCCGTTGLRYVVVPGFFVDEASAGAALDGRRREVEPIAGEALQREIRQAIRGREGIDQVVFW